jgi:hypothetical protein
LGEQTPPPAVQTFGAAQSAISTTVQTPDATLQHRPELGQVLGLQTPALVQVLGEAQVTSMTTVQAPVVELQHDPVGGWGQGLGEQTPPPPVQTFGDAQSATSTTVQAPDATLQHRPEFGQVLGLQTPSLVQVLGEAQLDCVTAAVQAPVVELQQEPVGGCGHGLGEQAPPTVQTFGTVQLAAITTVQAPVAALQHRPVCAPPSTHVSPLRALLLVTPPKSTVTARAVSKAAAGWFRGEGPLPVRWVQAPPPVPFHSQVSPLTFGNRPVLPPKSTVTLRVAS